MINNAVYNAALTGRYAPATALLQSQLQHPEALANSLGSRWIALGDLQRLGGDRVAAAHSYANAKKAIQAALRGEPDDYFRYQDLAYAEAGLGHREAAYEHSRHAIDLLPASKDAYFGIFFEETLARIQARFGDADAAITGLQHLMQTAYGDPPLSAALLRADPDFVALRGDRRFQKLIAEGDHPTPMRDALP